MKVLIVIPSFYPAITYGGSIFASYYLTKEAAKMNINFCVSTTNANGKNKLDVISNKLIELNNFKIKYYDEFITNYLSFKLIFGIWKDIRINDLIHLQGVYSYPIPFVLFYSFILNKKLFFSPRGSLSSYSFSKNGLIKKIWINLFIRPFSKKIIWHATSQKEKNEINNFFPKSKIKIIQDGVYVEDFKFTKKENYIAALGRLHPVKGFDLLIKAFSYVSKIKPNFFLKIAGSDDGDLNRLKKIVAEHSLDEKVLFIGQLNVKEKNIFLRKSQCLVMPSHTENFGIVALEALSQGTPVIASKNTPWQIIENRNAGYWIENNINQISNSIIRIINNKQTNYKENCINLAKEFDWMHIAKLYKKELINITNE
tara:strand:- start:130 stop:1239 length:1110 start_codon:yes stop_codon:yes gene_type:complete